MRSKIFAMCFLIGITISCVEGNVPEEFKAAPEACPEACAAIEKAKCDLSGTDESCLSFCTRMETGSLGTYLNPKCQKTIKTCSDMDRCMANNTQPSAKSAGSPGVVNPRK